MRRFRSAALTAFVTVGAAAIPAPSALAGGISFQAAADGQSVVSALDFSLPELTARDSGGWSASQLTPGEYRYFSRDLSCRVLESAERLAPGAPEGAGRNLFRREPDGSYTVLSSLEPANAPAGGGDRYRSVAASSDCSHVVFETDYAYPGLGAAGLYEWSGGALRAVGVLPDDSPAAGATLGAAGGANRWRSVSGDGARIVFSATSNDDGDAGAKAVFVREDGASTVEASASKTATPNKGALYQLASLDGSRVLFLANYGLTSTTSAGPVDGNCALSPPRHCDLYEYDVETGELVDLSAHGGESGGAMVAGVLGGSDDASRVYFAARGRLVPGEGRFAVENIAGGTYNVFLSDSGQLRFVGLLGGAEVVAGSDRNGALVSRSSAASSPWASRVTSDGGHLLFPSTADALGYYDSGGVVEAYLYEADADMTVCVSCRRDLEPSVGVAPGGAAPTTPLASDGSVGHGNPLQPPRTLSADGSRVFFEKPDALAPGAVGGRGNLYEWNGGQVSLLVAGSPPGAAHRTRFEGAGDDGDDVFVSTLDRFVPRDVDDAVDLYDLRVGGGLAHDATVPCGPFGPICPDSGNPAPPPTAKPRRPALAVEGLSAAQRARLAAGGRVKLAVRVARAGKVSVRGVVSVGRRRVTAFEGSRRARRAGTVRVPVALTKAARTRIAKAGSLRVRLTVRLTGVRRPVVRTVVLRKRRPAAPPARRSA